MADSTPLCSPGIGEALGSVVHAPLPPAAAVFFRGCVDARRGINTQIGEREGEGEKEGEEEGERKERGGRGGG